VVLKDSKIAFEIESAKPGEGPETPAAESGEPAMTP
jgi:hypothetical protein